MPNRYYEFEWDDFNSGKNLQKHGVGDLEIEQVFSNPYVIMEHKRFPDRKIVLGVTHGGRYLFMSIQHLSKIYCRPIHARDMKKGEKKAYMKAIGIDRR